MMIHQLKNGIPLNFMTMSPERLIKFYDATKAFVDKKYDSKIEDNLFHEMIEHFPKYKKRMKLEQDYEFSKQAIQIRLGMVANSTLELKIDDCIEAINNEQPVPELKPWYEC